MAIRVVVTQHVAVYDDVEQKDCLYNPEQIKRVHDTFDRHASGKFKIAGSGTETLSFGDVDEVHGYCIELQPASASTQVPDATLNVNGLGVIPLVPGTNPGIAGALYDGAKAGTPITSLEIVNNGATDLIGRYVVWGDPTP